MRIPTFSRQTETDTPEAERPAPASTATSTNADTARHEAATNADTARHEAATNADTARHEAATNADTARREAATNAENARREADRAQREAVRARHDEPITEELPAAPARADRNTPPPPPPSTVARPVFPKNDHDTKEEAAVDRTPVATGPKPRASLLATLGLILGVGSVLLVLSGPLLGWGIGVAVLALILSLAGIHATGKRHVAGKTDALIGMVLALGAIVLGVLALTGSLSWLGTDTDNVPALREWLDAHTVNRF